MKWKCPRLSWLGNDMMKSIKLRYTCILLNAEMMHLYKDPCSLAYYLAESGAWESTVVYFGPHELHHKDFEEKVRLVYLGDTGIYKKNYRIAQKYVKEHALDMDVIMVFNYGTVSYGLTRTAIKYNPDVVTYCKLDMSDGGFSHFNARSLWRKLMSIGELVKSRHIDLFTVESKAFYKELLKQPVFKNKLEYLPNGVSEIGVDLPALDRIKKEKIIVTIGRLGTHQKNNELLLEAIKLLQNRKPALVEEWHFVFAGPANESFQRSVMVFKQEFPQLADRISLTGHLDTRTELYEICARAKIICMTSRWESFGIATVEGMYFGCCPVITDYGGVAHDIVPFDVPWGKVVEQKAEAVAEALERFMANDSLEELNRQVCEFARDKFNYRMLANVLDGNLRDKIKWNSRKRKE